jgi:CRISPR system Cascade subunit CasE
MYLTKINLTTVCHRLVMAGFPQTTAPSARAEFAALFRVDNDSALIQSAIAPDYSRVVPPELVQTRSFEPQVIDGQSYRFRLAINSIKRKSRSGADIPVDPHEWMAARDFGAEFDITSATHDPVTELSGDRRVRVNRWGLEGSLIIADAERLTTAISQGIGRGRAWGCGLLSIVPIHSGCFSAET